MLKYKSRFFTLKFAEKSLYTGHLLNINNISCHLATRQPIAPIQTAKAPLPPALIGCAANFVFLLLCGFSLSGIVCYARTCYFSSCSREVRALGASSPQNLKETSHCMPKPTATRPTCASSVSSKRLHITA